MWSSPKPDVVAVAWPYSRYAFTSHCHSQLNVILTFDIGSKNPPVCLVLSQWPEHCSPSRRVPRSVSQRNRQLARHHRILQLNLPTKPHRHPGLLRKPTGICHCINHSPILLNLSNCIPTNSYRSRPRPQHRHDKPQQRPALQVVWLRLRPTHLHYATQVLPITPAPHAFTEQARTSRVRSLPR